MRYLSRCLRCVPLLLLVPLGVLKWRADHPDINTLVQDSVEQASWVSIHGLSGMDEHHCLLIEDKGALHALAQTLHCGEHQTASGCTCAYVVELSLVAHAQGPATQRCSNTYFSYTPEGATTELSCDADSPGGRAGETVARASGDVDPDAIPRFQALMKRFVQNAQTGGYPGLTIAKAADWRSPQVP